LTISGTGNVTVIVTGDILQQSENVLSIANEAKGETEKVQNPLITDATRGQTVGDWIKSYLNNRKIISSNWRADPRVDTLDIVTNVNKFNSNSVRLTSVNISFAGAFKGTAEGRMI
jgi:hypothetical protein